MVLQREALIQDQISFLDLFSYIWIFLHIYRSLLHIDLPFIFWQRGAPMQNQISFIDLFSYICIFLRISRSLLRIDFSGHYSFNHVK